MENTNFRVIEAGECAASLTWEPLKLYGFVDKPLVQSLCLTKNSPAFGIVSGRELVPPGLTEMLFSEWA